MFRQYETLVFTQKSRGKISFFLQENSRFCYLQSRCSDKQDQLPSGLSPARSLGTLQELIGQGSTAKEGGKKGKPMRLHFHFLTKK
jgi:hypothetical protein